MKRSLPVSLGLFIGLTCMSAQSAPVPRPHPGGAAIAAREDSHHGGKDNDRRFNDHDRQFAHEYAQRHKDDRGFRDRDRLPEKYESRIHDGYVMDKYMRQQCRPAPPDLIRGMAPAPYGYRYVVVGGQVCLIDRGYRIHDTIGLELNLGL